MGCNCGKNKAQFAVKTSSGKTVFVTASRETADGVATRYDGGHVVELAKT